MLGINKRNAAISYYFRNTPDAQFTDGARFASLINGLVSGHKKAFAIAQKMNELEPNFAWMRGGELAIYNGIAVIDHSGADGLVGEDVFRHAVKDHLGKRRKNPVIMRIAWEEIVDALAAGLIHIGSHHVYDVSIFASLKDPELISWQRKHLTVYRIPNPAP